MYPLFVCCPKHSYFGQANRGNVFLKMYCILHSKQSYYDCWVYMLFICISFSVSFAFTNTDSGLRYAFIPVLSLEIIVISTDVLTYSYIRYIVQRQKTLFENHQMIQRFK